MRPRLRETIDEVPATLALAWPVVVGQLGLMFMSLVDTLMVKPLGADAIAAVSVAHAVHMVFFMFGLGVMFGLDRVVAFAFGEKKIAECKHACIQGVWLATALSIGITIVLQLMANELGRFGYEPRIVEDAAGYLRAVSWSLWPSLVIVALRQTLQAMGDVRFANLVMLLANVANAGLNHLLIHGTDRLPAMGVAGSGWATTMARFLILFALVAYVWWRGIGPKDAATTWRPEPVMLRRLLQLGLPAGIQLVLEGGVFSLTGLLAAGLGDVPGAANQIVLQVASTTFMVPLAMSTAGAVRVGQALGRGDPLAARRAGWTAVSLGVAFMAFSGMVLTLVSAPLLGLFAPDPQTLVLAQQLIVVAAVFQLFDGAQVTLAGTLRGTAHTLEPMVANLLGHWAIGLPIGIWLCYRMQLGAVGLWIGLAFGLAAVASGLLVIWQRRIQSLVVAGPSVVVA